MKRFAKKQTQSCKLLDNCVGMHTDALLGGGGDLELAPQGFQDGCHSEGVYPKESSLLLISKAGLLRHKPRNDKFGFTLAEVLITLGIIGVVAAMTMPSVVGKYRAKVLRTKFLQANVIVQDSVSQMRNDEVDLNEVINKRDSSTINKYFKNGNCALPENASEAGYKNFSGTQFADTAVATVLEQPYCLANGMTLWFVRLKETNIAGDWSSGFVDVNYSLLAVDINGWMQRPNAYGKDVFFWFYNGNTGALSPTGSTFNIDSNVSNLYKKCNKSSVNAESGAGCTSEALSDPYYFDKLHL